MLTRERAAIIMMPHQHRQSRTDDGKADGVKREHGHVFQLDRDRLDGKGEVEEAPCLAAHRRLALPVDRDLGSSVRRKDDKRYV